MILKYFLFGIEQSCHDIRITKQLVSDRLLQGCYYTNEIFCFYFIVSKTLTEGGNSGFQEKMSYFKEECGKLSRIGIQIAKMCTGIDSDITKEWKERNEDFEIWCKKNK